MGDPWANFDPYADSEPLDEAVIRVAAERGLDPHALDEHVGGVHGWESHDVGYDRAVADAADCLAGGRCDG